MQALNFIYSFQIQALALIFAKKFYAFKKSTASYRKTA